MLSLQEQLLYTTLKIECFDSNKRLYSIGTGFLISRPVGEKEIKIYLVSNKHVFTRCRVNFIDLHPYEGWKA